MLSASPRMSGFIYQVRQLQAGLLFHRSHPPVPHGRADVQNGFSGSSGKFPSAFPLVFPQGRMSLSGVLISRIEDGETLRNAFEITGAFFTR